MVKKIKINAVLVLLHIQTNAQLKVSADENALQFLNGKLAIKKESYWGYINTDGIKLLDFVIPETLLESEIVPQPLTNTFIQHDNKLEKFGLIDGNGINITKLVFSKIIGFSENIGTAIQTIIYKIGNQKIETSQAVYLNESGIELFKLPPQVYLSNRNLLKWDYLDNFGLFNEGLAYMPTINIAQSGEAIYGYINNKRITVIKPSFVNAGKFSEGIAIISRYNNYKQLKWGAIDKTGKTVVDFIYTSEPSNFKNGLSRIKSNEDKYSFINKSGKLIINAKYDWASEFYNGFALVGNYSTANNIALPTYIINTAGITISNVTQYYFISFPFYSLKNPNM